LKDSNKRKTGNRYLTLKRIKKTGPLEGKRGAGHTPYCRYVKKLGTGKGIASDKGGGFMTGAGGKLFQNRGTDGGGRGEYALKLEKKRRC